MLQVQNLSHYFGAHKLFENLNFQIFDKAKIGLVGRNGTGKTTLFKIINKDIKATEGSIVTPGIYNIGYLKQFLESDNALTVRQATKKVYADYYESKEKLVEIEKKLADETSDSADLLNQYDDLTVKISSFIQQPDKEIELVLKGLGFKDADLDRKIGEFSGGWKMRVELAKLLLARHELILLDEPTNHLDIESIIWFENYLKKYTGSYILISHDKRFLDNTVTQIFDLYKGKLEIYQGNYSKFVKEKEERNEILKSSSENQKKKLDERQKLVDRFRAKATKAKMAQSIQKQIDKEEIIEYDDGEFSAFNLRWGEVPRAGRDIVTAKEVSKAYGEHLVFSNVNMGIEREEKVAFIGQNGMGKTTLLKIIAKQINESSGECVLGSNVSTYYFAQDQTDGLDTSLTVLQTIEERSEEKYRTKLRSILGAFLFSGEDVDKKVSVLSGGEKSRLAMACMMCNTFNFLILDEPTNHLDMMSKNILKTALLDFKGTLLIVSHDREFLSGLSTKTYEFRAGQVKEYLGDIDYVLEKRGMDFRELQINQAKGEQKAEKKNQNYHQRKKMTRLVSNLEKKIEKHEANIAEIHSKLADPNVYNSEEFVPLSKKLKEEEQELEKKMEEWEAASAKLDAL